MDSVFAISLQDMYSLRSGRMPATSVWEKLRGARGKEIQDSDPFLGALWEGEWKKLTRMKFAASLDKEDVFRQWAEGWIPRLRDYLSEGTPYPAWSPLVFVFDKKEDRGQRIRWGLWEEIDQEWYVWSREDPSAFAAFIVEQSPQLFHRDPPELPFFLGGNLEKSAMPILHSLYPGPLADVLSRLEISNSEAFAGEAIRDYADSFWVNADSPGWLPQAKRILSAALGGEGHNVFQESALLRGARMEIEKDLGEQVILSEYQKVLSRKIYALEEEDLASFASGQSSLREVIRGKSA